MNIVAFTLAISFAEPAKDYLEIKEQISALREKYGEDNWLSSHAGTFVQDIMGLQCSSYSIVIPDSTPTSLEVANSGQDSAIHLIKRTEAEDSEYPAKGNREIDKEKKGQTEASNEEESVSETSDAASALVNISEPLYDPIEGKIYIRVRGTYINSRSL